MNGAAGATAIIGRRRLAQLEDNLKAIAVTEDDKRQIDEHSALVPMASAFYEATFGPQPYR